MTDLNSIFACSLIRFWQKRAAKFYKINLLLFGVIASILLLYVSTSAQEAPHITITPTDQGIRLDWEIPLGQTRWMVLRSEDPLMLTPDTIALTSNNFWLDRDILGRNADHLFYSIQPWIPGETPDDEIIIEDFETGEVELNSYANEDVQPNGAQVIEGGPDDSQWMLRMNGNSWKFQNIDPIELDQETVWAVDVFHERMGRHQMIGIGDGEDIMYYLLWGHTLQPRGTDPWITPYLGWYSDYEWVTIYMPVGADWHGRFANYGPIDRIFYVNDSDGFAQPGIMYFDNVRDVTNAWTLSPDAAFQWTAEAIAQDSITYQFYNLSRDPDSDVLEFRWSFGDGTMSREEQPCHTFPRGGRWHVTLTANDDGTDWAYTVAEVVDSPLTLQSDFTISNMGDVVFKGTYGDMINNYGMDYPLEFVADYIRPADLAICNLENPMTTANTPHPTKGIVFRGAPQHTQALRNAGYDLVSIANNHTFDYLVDGMHETMEALDNFGILWGGMGDNDIQARQVTHLSYGGKSLAVICMCNRDGHYNTANPPWGPVPFLDAARNRPGFAMWNRTGIEETIPAAAANNDLVMAQVHCGSEYSLYPVDGEKSSLVTVNEIEPDEPWVVFELHPDSGEVALRHYAIDMGASVVVCHHPHVIQGVEIYHGRLIVHSLGNFLFDLSQNETMYSMIAELHVGADSIDNAVLRPAWIEANRPQIARGGFASNLLDYITYYSWLMNTQVVRMPNEEIGHVMWDTTYARLSESAQSTFEWEFVDEEYRTRPFRLDGEGYPTRVEVIDPPGGTVEIRYGRDILIWANMEDEGSQCWNLNSNYEFYDSEHAIEGERSIKLNIPFNAPNGSYTTEFERKVALNNSYDHSFLGWMYTVEADEAKIQVLLYNGRDDNNANETSTPLTLSGTNNWTPAFTDFDNLQGNRNYVNVRLAQSRPTTGTAQAWFDHLSFIEWRDWVEVDADNGIDVPYVSGFRFAQIRTNVPPQAADHGGNNPRRDELDRQGGPDAFGYYWIDNEEAQGPTYEWVEMEGVGTIINNMPDDNFQGPFPLPFNFNFYGNDYDHVFICSNGYIMFGGGSGAWRNSNIPNPADPNNIICLFRDDLDPTQGGNIIYGVDPLGRWVCQFNDIREYRNMPPRGYLTAEVILFPDNTILFQYESFNNNIDIANESIGIENADGTIGLQISYQNTPANYPYAQLAIIILHSTPDASIVGMVTDSQTNDPIEGAYVQFGGFGATTTADGSYLIEGVFSGQYNVTVRAVGYFTYQDQDVDVLPGENRFDFTLGSAPNVMARWIREYPANTPTWGGIYEEYQAMK